MSDDDRESFPSNPTRRTFLLTTGSSVAASVVAAYVPVVKGAAGESDSASTSTGPIEGAVPLRCALTVRSTSFASIRGRRYWTVFVRLLS
jgi:hypothetical protein